MIRLALTALLLVSATAMADDTDRVLLRTSLGDMVIALNPKLAPKHAAQFRKLVELGVYDSVRIHRIEPGFVTQVSSAQDRRIPLTPEQSAAIHRIPAEFTAVQHTRGMLSMARADHDPDSAETSFSFLLGDAPHLNGKYTIFGQVLRGWEVLSAFENQDRNGTEPAERLEINLARVITAAELARIQLAPARMGNANAQPGRAALIAAMAAILFGGLLLFVLAGRLPPQSIASVGLVFALVAGFGLLVLLTPLAQRDSRVALALFLGLVALFKLMNQFEKPRAV